LSAADNSEIKAYAAAGSLAFTIGGAGLGVAVGAAIADNEIDNTVKTYISGATVTGGSLELTSSSNSSIESLAVAASISATVSIASLGLAGGGASAANDLSNDLESFIGDESTVTTNGVRGSGAIKVSASDQAQIHSAVGSGALTLLSAVGASIGVSVAENNVNNTVKAYIGKALVTSLNDDLEVSANSMAKIEGLSVATSVAISATGFAGAGGDAKSTIASTVEAYTTGEATLEAGQDISFKAISNHEAKANTYGIAAAGLAAVGTSLAKTIVGGSTRAHLDGLVTNAKNLEITAESTGKADAYAFALGGGTLSGAGADAGAYVAPTIEAYCGGVIHVAGNVEITSQAEVNADTEALGVAAGGLAVGASIAESIVSPNITAHVGGQNSLITADSLSVTAVQSFPAGSYAAKSHATGASGGLIGINATVSTAKNTGTVTSYVADQTTLAVYDVIEISAVGDSAQHAEGDSYSVGLIAAGGNVVTAFSDVQTNAYLGYGVTINAGTEIGGLTDGTL
jgi:hypothetical protein